MSQAQQKIEEEIPGASQELIVWEKLNPAELFKKGGLDSVLKEIDEKARSVILGGIETQKDRDNIRAIASKGSKAKTFVQKIGTKNTEEYRSLTKESNTERDRGVAFLQDLQDDIREPLTEYENAEKEKKQKIEDAIDSLSAYATFEEEPDSVLIKMCLNNLQDEYSNFAFPEEYKDRAGYIYDRAKIALTTKLEDRIKYEADQKELEELRTKKSLQDQKDEEDRIRQDAADIAKKEAEDKAKTERESSEKAAADKLAAEQEKTRRLEQDKKDAKDREEKAEADRIAAEKKAKDDKQAAVQAEKDRVAAKEKREKEESDKREANKKHRAKINNEVISALQKLMENGINGEDPLKDIVIAMAKGEIPHVTISY